jgi:hypothetical protein
MIGSYPEFVVMMLADSEMPMMMALRTMSLSFLCSQAIRT